MASTYHRTTHVERRATFASWDPFGVSPYCSLPLDGTILQVLEEYLPSSRGEETWAQA